MTFSQWYKNKYGETWAEVRRELFAQGLDRNTVDNVIKSGLTEDYEKEQRENG